MRILLVEDDDRVASFIRRGLRALLRRRGDFTPTVLRAGDLEMDVLRHRGRRDDFGTAPPEPVASFVTQFRDWCFSGEPAQLACQIPALPSAI